VEVTTAAGMASILEGNKIDEVISWRNCGEGPHGKEFDIRNFRSNLGPRPSCRFCRWRDWSHPVFSPGRKFLWKCRLRLDDRFATPQIVPLHVQVSWRRSVKDELGTCRGVARLAIVG
jgi:hypothetical protein